MSKLDQSYNPLITEISRVFRLQTAQGIYDNNTRLALIDALMDSGMERENAETRVNMIRSDVNRDVLSIAIEGLEPEPEEEDLPVTKLDYAVLSRDSRARGL